MEKARLDQDLVEELASLLEAQVRLLGARQELSLSLTGGIDSRTTLAASLCRADSILCFTYIEKERDKADADIARPAVRRTGN